MYSAKRIKVVMRRKTTCLCNYFFNFLPTMYSQNYYISFRVHVAGTKRIVCHFDYVDFNLILNAEFGTFDFYTNRNNF